MTIDIVLENPKHLMNVAMIVRLLSAWGGGRLFYTGKRASQSVTRIPREMRKEEYKDVELIHTERPFDYLSTGTIPIAVEVLINSENLLYFQHPTQACYVFGPEDNSIKPVFMRHCHKFVTIPTNHCLNLATAVSTVLWDRKLKLHEDFRQTNT